MPALNYAKIEYYQRQEDKRWLIKAIDVEGFATHMGSWISVEEAKEWRKIFIGQSDSECVLTTSYTKEEMYWDNERSDKEARRD